MPRFFIRQEQIEDGVITLKGDDAHHIARSLRMAVGEGITVCDMQGNEYECRIDGFDDDARVFAKIISSSKSETEPPCRITLFQALSKGDKLDTVIQKAVECGVYKIIPFESERCVVKVKADAEERKTERRRRISAEAAKQCGRSIVPEVSATVDFDTALKMACDSELKLFCYEGDGTEALGKIISEKLCQNADGEYPDVAVIIGSEGGFSINEAQRAKDNGMELVGLGKRILRTETAPVFVLSCLVCATELK
ncbi:MAG: 16S rRNA (uracil(1498)-N(3))-methyltransferase [Clostridia bacterium]|nr:16S rRNA (uracil(1498)-N(3))-methyltransferase [Clostridia bacterium]